MPPKNRRYRHPNSTRPFTIHIRPRNMAWVRATAGMKHGSAFVDGLIHHARVRDEHVKLNRQLARMRTKIAELQGEIIQLGGTVTVESLADVDETNEELQ